MTTEKNSIFQKPWALAGTAFLCCLLWGSAFAFVKLGYNVFSIAAEDWASQMVFAGVRFFIAGWMAFAIGSLTEKRLLLPKAAAIPKIFTISLFQTILQYFFYYIGLAHTTGVKAAILVGSNVFFSIFISALLFRQESLTLRKLLGCTVGFSGIVLINLGGLRNSSISFSLLGDGFILLCTIASGFSSVFMRKYSKGESPVLLSAWQFTLGGAVLWALGAIFHGNLGNITPKGVILLLYLSFVSAAAYSLWAMLLKYNPVSKVSVYGLLNPVCGVILSAILLRESGAFRIESIAALALVCVGIAIVNWRSKAIS